MVNGSFTNGTAYSSGGNGTTDSYGNVCFAWAANYDGIYSMKALFEGSENYLPCEVYVSINASVAPFGVLFEVSPVEFEFGASLRLNATIMDASTNRKVSGGCCMNVSFIRVGSDGSNVVLRTNKTSTGEAIFNTVYPTGGVAYAYMARIDSVYQDGRVPQGMVSNPVQLTASNSTVLLLDVTRDYNSYWHTVHGYLKHNNLRVANRLVNIRINGSLWGSRMTNVYGFFSLDCHLYPVNNNVTTYIVTASFDGDSGINATAWANTPDGTPYPACITIQFAYKASANMTIVTVDPQATQLMRMIKSPEEMQREAQNNGWLGVWHEFSWWPPWCWLHARTNMGGASIHVVFSPILPFWPGGVQFTGLDTLLSALPSNPLPPNPPPPPQNETSRILEGMVAKVLLNILGIATIAVVVANIAPLPAAVLAMGIYGVGAAILIALAVQTYYSSEWGAHTKAHANLASLLVAFAGAAIVIEMSFSAGAVFKSVVISLLSAFLVNLVNPLSLETALASACFSMWISLAAALIILKLPNPLFGNIYFRPAFLITNLVLFTITMGIILGLPL